MATETVESVILEFLNTASSLEQRLDRALSSIRGISFSEYKLLSALTGYQDVGTARAELAAQVGLTPSAITRALRPLEKLGYIETAKHARDARQSLTFITDAGLQLQADARSVVADTLNELAISDATDRQLAEFASRLATIRSVKR